MEKIATIITIIIIQIIITTIYILLERAYRRYKDERSKIPKFTDDEMIQLTERLNSLGYLIIFEKYATHATIHPLMTEERSHYLPSITNK